jgi:hypothetical protein
LYALRRQSGRAGPRELWAKGRRGAKSHRSWRVFFDTIKQLFTGTYGTSEKMLLTAVEIGRTHCLVSEQRASTFPTGSQQGKGRGALVCPFLSRGAERKEARTDGIEGRLRPTLAILRRLRCGAALVHTQRPADATRTRHQFELVQGTAEAPPTGGACTSRRGSPFRRASLALCCDGLFTSPIAH